jgi:hypothetical protein
LPAAQSASFVRLRAKIIAVSILSAKRSHSVGCGTNKRRMLSGTPNIAAVHMMPVIRVYDKAGNVIETNEHKGDFKEP